MVKSLFVRWVFKLKLKDIVFSFDLVFGLVTIFI